MNEDTSNIICMHSIIWPDISRNAIEVSPRDNLNLASGEQALKKGQGQHNPKCELVFPHKLNRKTSSDNSTQGMDRQAVAHGMALSGLNVLAFQ